MVRKKGNRRRLITTLIVLGVLLLVIGIVAIVRATSSHKDDPYTQPEATTQEKPADTSKGTTKTGDDEKASQDTSANTAEPTIDPSQLASIDIAPMSLTVSYVKGIGGFEYQVLRTPSGTQYVEFLSAELVGSKCTDDQGVFASILANPAGAESATVTKTTTVDGTKYGLSLASAACTSNPEALQTYQKSFTDAFSLLKKTN